jgi:hypothetical protein
LVSWSFRVEVTSSAKTAKHEGIRPVPNLLTVAKHEGIRPVPNLLTVYSPLVSPQLIESAIREKHNFNECSSIVSTNQSILNLGG